MVVVAEIYASNRGLGYLIFQAGGMYDTAQVFVGVGILAIAGVGLTALIRAFERWVAPWQTDARQAVGADADRLKQLNEGLKNLGLGG